jgi:hypothetical protein
MADKEFKSRIPPSRALGLAGHIAHRFIDSKLTPLVIVVFRVPANCPRRQESELLSTIRRARKPDSQISKHADFAEYWISRYNEEANGRSTITQAERK